MLINSSKHSKRVATEAEEEDGAGASAEVVAGEAHMAMWRESLPLQRPRSLLTV